MSKKEKELIAFLQEESILAEKDGMMITRGMFHRAAELLENLLKERDLGVLKDCPGDE